jgi:hypothetical protein
MDILPITQPALRDEKSIQMLSAWIAEEGLHCSMNIGFFEENGHVETEAWGTVLADVIKHIANARNEESGANVSDSIQSILDALQEELYDPSSEAEGEFFARPN